MRIATLGRSQVRLTRRRNFGPPVECVCQSELHNSRPADWPTPATSRHSSFEAQPQVQLAPKSYEGPTIARPV